MHPLVLKVLEFIHWLIQYQEKRVLFDWIPSHVGIRGNEKPDVAAKAGLLRRVTNILITFGDFKKHINVLMKVSSGMRPSTTNYMQFTPNWVCAGGPGGLRIIRREESVLARIRIGHTYLTPFF